MDLPIVLSHKTAWLYHNVARPSEPLSRASSLYDEDSLANEAEPTASLRVWSAGTSKPSYRGGRGPSGG